MAGVHSPGMRYVAICLLVPNPFHNHYHRIVQWPIHVAIVAEMMGEGIGLRRHPRRRPRQRTAVVTAPSDS